MRIKETAENNSWLGFLNNMSHVKQELRHLLHKSRLIRLTVIQQSEDKILLQFFSIISAIIIKELKNLQTSINNMKNYDHLTII